jgi:hypothetical protein
MTTHEMALSFNQMTLSSRSLVKDQPFRIVLLPGELLSIPRKHRSIRVLAGSAWVSNNGCDHALYSGDVLPLRRAKHEALVSAEGESLFLEIA